MRVFEIYSHSCVGSTSADVHRLWILTYLCMNIGYSCSKFDDARSCGGQVGRRIAEEDFTFFFHLNTPVNELWVYNVRLRCTRTCFTCAIVNANVEANGLMLWCVYCTVSPSLYDVSTTMPSMCTQTMDENTVGRRIIHFIHTVNALDMNVSQFMLFTMLPKTRIFFSSSIIESESKVT